MTPQTVRLDLLFSALADPTRRAILAQLMAGETTVNELVEPAGLAQPTVSKHLKVLERAGLVARRRDAQFRPVMLNAAALVPAAEWIDAYRRLWEGRLDRLGALAQNLHRKEKVVGRKGKRR